MLDGDLSHGEVVWVPRYETRVGMQSRGGDEAVGLRERDAARCVVSSPRSGVPSLAAAQRKHEQPIEKHGRRFDLATPKAARDLLDVDGRRARDVAVVAMRP